MEPEQCVEMMKSLSEAYRRAANAGEIPSHKVYELKHVVTEIDMYVNSMRKSVENMVQKIELRKSG